MERDGELVEDSIGANQDLTLAESENDSENERMAEENWEF